jgi:hypothetical protein
VPDALGRRNPSSADRTGPGIRCTGTTRQGKPCGNWAGPGTIRCRDHREDTPRCTGVNADGTPCTKQPADGSQTCISHTPERVAARGGTRCAATNTDGTQCKMLALTGLNVCRKHGGWSPTSRSRHAAAVEEEKARKALHRLGHPAPVENALLELQRFAGEVVAVKDYLRNRVFDMDETDWRYASAQQLEQVHGIVQVWERAMDRCATTLSALSRVQADERLAAIQEATLLMLLAALNGALAEGGVDTAAAAAIKQAFAKKVRVLKAGEVISGYRAINGPGHKQRSGEGATVLA